MTKKIYTTAKGKQVDLQVLLARNENVRAIGNMNVNARGDELDSKNRPIKTRQQKVQKYYKQQVSKEVVQENPLAKAQLKVKALEPDDINAAPVTPPPTEAVVFPADVLADDELADEVAETPDPVMDAVDKLDTIDQPLQPLRDVVEALQPTTSPAPTGLAAAIQKVKDNKSLKD